MKFKLYIASILLLVFSLNLFNEYLVYNKLKKEKLIELTSLVQNIYFKKNHNILKLSTKDFIFFTSVNKNLEIKKLDKIKVAIITRNINFYSFLKGFFVKNIYIENIKTQNSVKTTLFENIISQHSSSLTKELFGALFLAIPISTDLREITNIFGISHLLALSGFHLGLILFIFYWILYNLYSPFHQKYLPFRNKRFDTLIACGVLIFLYLLFTNIVPSLLRAFVMFVIGVYMLRNDIKIFSFLNLFLVSMIIVALFPRYAFSISLWFSLAGVFYILLYVKYLSSINKYTSFVLFNFWIFFALNPIIFYFFELVSFAQFLSAPLTLAFILFYPFEIVLHILNYGSLIDNTILWLFSLEFEIRSYLTDIYFLMIFLLVSFLAIFKKIAFYVLNSFIVIFNTYVYFVV